MDRNRKKIVLILGLILVFAMLFVACQPATTETEIIPPEDELGEVTEPAPAMETPVVETTEVLPETGATATPMEVTPEETEVVETEEPIVEPSVTVSDQEVDEDDRILLEEVVAGQLGWIVIHADDNGQPGEVIGYRAVHEGSNENIPVVIDTSAATETIYAMLHVDAGTRGEYEFPGADSPVQVNGEVVVQPFMVSGIETPTPEAAETANVAAVDTEFQPATISVVTGTTVVWTNEGELPHTVTADDGEFASGTLNSGDTFEFTFEEPGTYPYYCEFHGGPGGVGMSGVVEVTE